MRTSRKKKKKKKKKKKRKTRNAQHKCFVHSHRIKKKKKKKKKKKRKTRDAQHKCFVHSHRINKMAGETLNRIAWLDLSIKVNMHLCVLQFEREWLERKTNSVWGADHLEERERNLHFVSSPQREKEYGIWKRKRENEKVYGI